MSLNIVVNADVAQAGRQIDDFSKRSRQALLSLSLVAQDLPFGFIGIQNNLPGVVQQFGALRAESGSTLGALKALGSSLIGPAGLFLAFSAVTSAITFAIQKYGSLSNAIKAFTSSNSKLVEVQVKLNKELAAAVGGIAGEETKLRLLIKTINDSSAPQQDRLNAYAALKKIAPEIARGIDKENVLTKKNIDLINKNVEARLKFIRLKARETAITNIINKNEEERIALEQEYPDLLKNQTIAQFYSNKAKKQGFDYTKTFNAALDTEGINLQSATEALEKNAQSRRNLFNINNGLISQLEELIQGTSNYDKVLEDFRDSQKKQKEVKPPKELDIAEIERKGRIAANKILNQALANRTKAIAAALKEEERLQNEFRKRQEADIKKDIFAVDPLAALKKTTGPLLEEQQKLALAFRNINIILQNTFFQPLTDAFVELFETGKLNIKAFADSILSAIKQLVAKIIATGIISLLASILVPGGAIAAGSAAAGTSRFGGAILGLLGLGGQIAAPTFAGVGGGQLGFGGSVALTLRGSDLVGAINRTNTTISRVG